MHLRFNLRFKIQDLRLYYSTAHLFIYCDLILNYANFFIITLQRLEQQGFRDICRNFGTQCS